jgi:hypothetical protein
MHLVSFWMKNTHSAIDQKLKSQIRWTKCARFLSNRLEQRQSEARHVSRISTSLKSQLTPWKKKALLLEKIQMLNYGQIICQRWLEVINFAEQLTKGPQLDNQKTDPSAWNSKKGKQTKKMGTLNSESGRYSRHLWSDSAVLSFG